LAAAVGFLQKKLLRRPKTLSPEKDGKREPLFSKTQETAVLLGRRFLAFFTDILGEGAANMTASRTRQRKYLGLF
jgi:hypothetical protein